MRRVDLEDLHFTGNRDGRELGNVPREGVKEADDVVLVTALPLKKEKAFDRAEDEMALEKRNPRADKHSGVEVEETLPAVSEVESMAVGQHHPSTRMEARVGDAAPAWADGTGPPVHAHGAEADVVEQVSG
ncbi:hypothetical protein D1007_15865 [Hordeum vulgare]|nr:hypothetical protein D1007_15865 [Hordeum vulgare]